MACRRHSHIVGDRIVSQWLCVRVHKINAVNKSKSKWTADDRTANKPGWKKWEIIVSPGLPSEFLTGDTGAVTDAHGRLQISSHYLQEKLAHYANSCIILPRHLLILRSASAINFMRYSLRLYKTVICRLRAEFRRSSVMWCDTNPLISSYSSSNLLACVLTSYQLEQKITFPFIVRSPDP